MKTLTTLDELKNFLKDIPKDAIVHINKGSGIVCWSPVSLDRSCSNAEELGPNSYHGEKAILKDDLLKLLH